MNGWSVGYGPYSVGGELIHSCPESRPRKNSTRAGPRNFDSRGNSKGATLSILNIVIGAALSLNRNGPVSLGPSHAVCLPNENCTFFRFKLTAPSSS